MYLIAINELGYKIEAVNDDNNLSYYLSRNNANTVYNNNEISFKDVDNIIKVETIFEDFNNVNTKEIYSAMVGAKINFPDGKNLLLKELNGCYEAIFTNILNEISKLNVINEDRSTNYSYDDYDEEEDVV